MTAPAARCRPSTARPAAASAPRGPGEHAAALARHKDMTAEIRERLREVRARLHEAAGRARALAEQACRREAERRRLADGMRTLHEREKRHLALEAIRARLNRGTASIEPAHPHHPGLSPQESHGDGADAAPLTRRQREVLQLLAEGRSNKEIGTSLGITTKTAETHRAAIMSALDLHSMSQLVRYAIRHHVIEP